MEVQSFNHWTIREVPEVFFFFKWLIFGYVNFTSDVKKKAIPRYHFLPIIPARRTGLMAARVSEPDRGEAGPLYIVHRRVKGKTSRKEAR